MALREFTVDASDPAHPKVVVDGVDQHDLSRVGVELYPGQTLPQLFLEFRAGGSFRGVGEVQVGVPPGAALRAWLDTVSPGELDRVALAMDTVDGGLSRSPGATFLAALRSMLPAE
jgi:hypothetical protein